MKNLIVIKLPDKQPFQFKKPIKLWMIQYNNIMKIQMKKKKEKWDKELKNKKTKIKCRRF